MRPFAVIEIEIPANGPPRFTDIVVGPEIDFFIFDRTPELLDKDIIAPAPFAIHADGDAIFQQQFGKVDAGELAARSVLNISGLPCMARASSTASRQKTTFMLC
jgi:hypothetical protein